MPPAEVPHTVEAVSWDTELDDEFSRHANPTTGAIHSRHQRTVNVLLPGDSLLTLASDELDDAPRTIRLPHWDVVSSRVSTSVTIASRTVRIDDRILVALPPSRRWNPALTDLSGLTHERLVYARAALLAAIPPPSTSFAHAANHLLAHGTQALRDTLRHSNTNSRHAVELLIGLGEGLTPSGDDILAGMAFLAAQPGMQLSAALPDIRRSIDRCAHRTTLLSIATIREALDGRGRQSMHNLADAIQKGRPEEAIAPVAAIGHTSGGDILTGMALALDIEDTRRAENITVPQFIRHPSQITPREIL